MKLWLYLGVIEFIDFRMPTACRMAVDIPPQFADTEKYNGTLGHKVNHDFNPNSIYVIMYDSAR